MQMVWRHSCAVHYGASVTPDARRVRQRWRNKQVIWSHVGCVGISTEVRGTSVVIGLPTCAADCWFICTAKRWYQLRTLRRFALLLPRLQLFALQYFGVTSLGHYDTDDSGHQRRRRGRGRGAFAFQGSKIRGKYLSGKYLKNSGILLFFSCMQSWLSSYAYGPWPLASLSTLWSTALN